MEETTSYRKLKNPKLHQIQGISKRLLKGPQHRLTANDKDYNLANKNVSMYEYMLVNSYIKQNYINWAINLRSNSSPKISEDSNKHHGTQSLPPQVFFKNTRINELRGDLKQKKLAVNTSEFNQFFNRSKSSKNVKQMPKQHIDYLNNLRCYDSDEPNHKKPRFNNDASKSSELGSKFLKKNNIKKLRDVTGADKQNSFDGTHQFPKYNQKNVRQKNIAMLNKLVKKGDKVSLPTLTWSVGLRSYEPTQKH